MMAEVHCPEICLVIGEGSGNSEGTLIIEISAEGGRF